MALLSDYSAGTITVAANGTAVSGSGTAWATAGFQEGDLFFANGFVGIILSVESNIALTLAQPWKGGALAGSSYRLRYQGDGSRLTAQARQLIELLSGSGNLDALSGLQGAADKLPYFTGAGTMSLATISAFARSIIDEPDVASFMDKLGAGTKGQDILGATSMANLFSKLGPMFGGPAPTPSSAEVGLTDGDFNTIIVPGVYTIAGTWVNGPNGSGSYTGVLEVRARTFNNGFWQILRVGTDTRRRYTNSSGGAAWNNAWERIENPTVGSVSQSGGIPTGSVIERGSNANGEYVRFADGTQICWGTGTVSAVTAANNLFGATSGVGVYGNATVVLPAAFSSTLYSVSNQPTFRGFTVLGAYSKSLSSFAIRMGVSGSNTADVPFEWYAIGRWF
jgi:hypothetical protein